jgi:hypothetical protein
MSKTHPIYPPIHDPTWVVHRSRELAGVLGLSCRVWLKEKDLRYIVLTTRSRPKPGQKKVYLSAGIHGDEAGSVLGLLTWLEQSARWLKKFHFTIFPCLNPWGLRNNSRLDAGHNDLNRCYARDEVASVWSHRQILQKLGPFDLALMLHEDYDAQGVYVYEVSADSAHWGHDLLRAAARAIPPDPRPKIEGRAADRGVIRRNLDSPSWRKRFQTWGYPEAVYMYLNHCPRGYTLETPSEFDLPRRARAHVLAVNQALQKLVS